MAFKKATKFESKLRMAIAGPAGAGKTFTALTLAMALAAGGEVALIDTEHGSASKYADLFSFDVLELSTFHPQRYIDAIHEAEQGGYAVLVIDSLSHAWTGQGGLLEEKEKIAKQKYGGNSFSAWNDASALQNKLVQAILGSSLHIICTVRSKMEYLQEKDEKSGRSSIRKVGMAPVQRDDLPYEFDVFCSMEIDNTLIVDKSRCPALSGAVIARPDARVADILKTWLSGEQAPARPVTEQEQPAAGQESVSDLKPRSAEQAASLHKLYQFLGKPEPDIDALSYDEARELIRQLSHEYNEQRQSRKAS